jgi:uroporphyrin-III C-methyltransferase
MTAGSGKVILVGAGPGDPELLTLKAVRALGQADVVLYDELVNPAILAFARPQARRIAVGKRGGCRSTPQAFIERLMVRYARSGALVVRLKGGDPFIFGRGGEELEALSARGIPAEVIPGITAGLAAAAGAGIALTHREECSAVMFLSGHPGSIEARRTEWCAAAASGVTLVIYMGIGNAAQIVRALLEAGLSAQTPAAIVQDASRPGERTLHTRLAALPQTLQAASVASPAILIIGSAAGRGRTAGAQTAGPARGSKTADPPAVFPPGENVVPARGAQPRRSSGD